jgi:hypothetical protein
MYGLGRCAKAVPIALVPLSWFKIHQPGSFVTNSSRNAICFSIKGHVIIQCGPIGMTGLVLSNGSVLLLRVAPHSMYTTPGYCHSQSGAVFLLMRRSTVAMRHFGPRQIAVRFGVRTT